MTLPKGNDLKALILDFDGVVILSNEIKDEAFRSIFTRRFPSRANELMRYHLAHNAIPRREKFKHVVQNVLKDQRGDELIDELTKEFETLTRKALIECAYGKGALEFLTYWTNHVPVFLSSATPQVDLDLVVDARGLRSYFRGAYGAPDRKADRIMKLLAELRILNHQCLFVGDSPEDLASAREAKVPFAGIHGKTEFEGESVPSFPDLAALDSALR